ncbi:MAG: hypothetical protein Q4G10_01875 [Bacteroidia bacterium]|nr:hypothetical protein [Bacteroidia bacterium]
MTEEELNKIWDDCKAREAKEQAEWDALPEEEKERRRKLYDPGFIYRISDDVTGENDIEPL